LFFGLAIDELLNKEFSIFPKYGQVSVKGCPYSRFAPGPGKALFPETYRPRRKPKPRQGVVPSQAGHGLPRCSVQLVPLAVSVPLLPMEAFCQKGAFLLVVDTLSKPLLNLFQELV
jgi:hypothetical protein